MALTGRTAWLGKGMDVAARFIGDRNWAVALRHVAGTRRSLPRGCWATLDRSGTRSALTTAPQTSLHNTPQPVVAVTCAALQETCATYSSPDSRSTRWMRLSRRGRSRSEPVVWALRFHEFINHMLLRFINHSHTLARRDADVVGIQQQRLCR